MNRGVKIVLAFGVLLGGIGLAMFFRQPSAPSPSPKPASHDRLVLRQQNEAGQAKPVAVGRLTAQIDPPEEVAPPPEAPQPSAAGPRGGEPGEPPPTLARSYPSFSGPPATSPATARAAERPGGEISEGSAGTHLIVDGDTLHGLAERYLGDADRYLEIYEANRDVLPSPEVLPIGARLRIPRRQGGRAPIDRGPKRPLVPVVPPS